MKIDKEQINVLRKRRRELEDEIRNALNRFQSDTGLHISQIGISYESSVGGMMNPEEKLDLSHLRVTVYINV